MHIEEEQRLGVELASRLGWDGYVIARVFAYAMEDANFHTDIAEIIAAKPELFEGANV
jgi:hypothetical protein